ncbi:serine/threonine protein kinase [Novosphingobium terrae]|uniref:serine/threonine protein kinase n=1 Tax=Novosphingobium terrae TaxID=2726189 RepID=UPI0019802B68|nr:serine/threonine-protein kinase [Novosphingobium terrae]
MSGTPEDDPQKTVFMPISDGTTGLPRGGTNAPPTQFAPRAPQVTIQVGDVLNHIFEVRRFIARGGMGEVFEGVNVTSDERVAIKVILPALAADPDVTGMFRKEARTLTGLRHDALVQYRVLAQEPQLGVLYIVTEYIDGLNLSHELGRIEAGANDLLALLRRLAQGLQAAHRLGAIHRDISPDNVLLEGGRLSQAKIIDFGIAKDISPGSATIVGDGFAGKLNYVAPEQLGDYGRDIGPWTDIYSLGLVVLAIAQGRDVSMGGSLVDAVNKRRAVPDLASVPEPLRLLLTGMLQPDPAKRLRSMDAVLAQVEAIEVKLRPTAVVAPQTGASGLPAGMKWGAAGLALVLVAGAGFWLMRPAGHSGVPVVSGTGSPADLARSTIDSVLPSVGCTWLQITDITPGPRGPNVKLAGVAGNPAAAQNEISQALAQHHIQEASIDFGDVAQITQSGCSALDTYRQVRAPDSHQLTVPQRKFAMRMQPNDPSQTGYPGEKAANIVLQLAIDDPKADFALIGLEPSGLISPEFSGPGTGVLGRDALKKLATETHIVTDRGNDHYQMQLDVNHTGWSGVLLLTGKGPFEKDVIAPPIGQRGPDWTTHFVSEAAARGWQAQMVWFKTVEEGSQ